LDGKNFEKALCNAVQQLLDNSSAAAQKPSCLGDDWPTGKQGTRQIVQRVNANLVVLVGAQHDRDQRPRVH
jgi:hypothetical protein